MEQSCTDLPAVLSLLMSGLVRNMPSCDASTCDLHGDNADGHRQPCPDADPDTVAVTPEEGDKHVNAEVAVELAGVLQNIQVIGGMALHSGDCWMLSPVRSPDGEAT